MAIEMHEAMDKARQAIEEIYGDEKLSDVEIEEIEWDMTHWLITVGFTRSKTRTTLGGLSIPMRTLKRVRIEKQNGTFEGMVNAPPR